VTPLERRCGRLLRMYPRWYRRSRGEEILGTLLEATPPGRTWPSWRDARALFFGGLRVRGGWTWLLSLLWTVTGAAGAGYFFLASTQPYQNVREVIPAWIPLGAAGAYIDAVALSFVLWVLLPVPVIIGGLVRLRGRDLRLVAWAGPWAAGFLLMYLAYNWGNYPSADLTYTCAHQSCSLNFGEPAVVSWGELEICAAWLVLAAVMTRILALRPARGQDVPGSREATPQSLTSGDLQP
jgi:hypothetical protein